MTAYPLSWPAGWKRTLVSNRRSAKFSKKSYVAYQGMPGGYNRSVEISIHEGTKRVLEQLRALGVREGVEIISTNLELRLDGLPRGNQKEPADPGVAVYWKKGKDTQHKVLAIDRYTRIADNLAAIAATLDAMRAIERHGGAVILERAFSGFVSLPAPNTWRSVMGYDELTTPTLVMVKDVYRQKALLFHPDMQGGSEHRMKELNWAMSEAEKELA